RRLRKRPACRLRTSAAPMKPSSPSRSRSSPEIETMPDRNFLHWPFFEDRHRALAERLETWATQHCARPDHRDVDAACRELVVKLGSDGWLKHSAPGDDPSEKIDVRTLALIRETLA